MSRQATSAHTDLQVLNRFWAKVVRDPSGCWVWTASKRNKGYGAFSYTVGDKMIQDRAHRFSWVIHNGDIPEGLYVLHRCDNPACVYPVHLFLGTKADNNADMLTKGRHVAACTYTRRGPNDPAGNHPKGEMHPGSRLTAETVLAIRADRAAGLSYTTLAEKYGITVRHAWRIVRRRVWRHLPAPEGQRMGPSGHNSPHGEDSPRAKLTGDDVREIRKLRSAGVKLKTIAEQFGITEANVSYIAKGKGWKHIL